MIRATKYIVMATFMNLISNEELRSKEMVRMRSILVMVLVLARWSLAGSAGSGYLQEGVTQRRRRQVSAGEEKGASGRAGEVEKSS